MGNITSCIGLSSRVERKNSNKLSEHDEYIGDNVEKVYKKLNKQYGHYKISSIEIGDPTFLRQYKDESNEKQVIHIYYNKTTELVTRVDIFP